MTEYQIYQIIGIVLYVLIVLIILYDIRSLTRYNYDIRHHFFRVTVAMLLAITLLYVWKCLDAIEEEQQNAKKFDQHFEIERADEKYITKF